MDIPSTHPIHRVYAMLGRFRAQRMRRFLEMFPITDQTRVLDIGGAVGTWEHVPVRPRLTLLNIYDRPDGLDAAVIWVKGDARQMPFNPGDFDVIFSNSVIEHVGTWDDQRQFAQEIRRLQSPFWIQTPDRYFPIEPHALGLGVQFLPRAWQAPYARFLSLRGLMTIGTPGALRQTLDNTRLLNHHELQTLFPGTPIWRETVLGLSKSLVAYQTAEHLAHLMQAPLAPVNRESPRTYPSHRQG